MHKFTLHFNNNNVGHNVELTLLRARWTGSNIRSLNAELSESRLMIIMKTKSAPI